MADQQGSDDVAKGKGRSDRPSSAASSMPALDPTRVGGRPWTKHLEPGKDLEDSAVASEVKAARTAWQAVAALTVALLLISLLRATGALPLGAPPTDIPDDESPWPRAMLAIILLMAASQLVSVLLVAEHVFTLDREASAKEAKEAKPAKATEGAQLGEGAAGAERPGQDALHDDQHHARHGSLQSLRQRWVRGTPAPPTIWVLRLAPVALVIAAVRVDWLGVDWWHVVVWGAVAQGVATAAYLGFAHGRGPEVVEPPAQRREGPPAEAPPDRATNEAVAHPGGPVAIGASGGGIRATAFALGGMHALQDHAARLGIAKATEEPAIFAVSGGSYMGAALTLRRRFQADGQPMTPTPWDKSYRPGSAEIERLRRHTRYLFEPMARWRDGLVTLVLGAGVNVIVVGLSLLFMTLVSATLAVTTGFVSVHRVTHGVGKDEVVEVDRLFLAQGWGTTDWLWLLALPLACLLAVVALTVVDWRGTAVFDDTDPGAAQRAKTMKTREKVALWRPLVIGLAAAWMLVVAGLPAVLVGVTDLTTSNKPTTTAAAALNGLGFGTLRFCQEGAVRNIAKAVESVSVEARISPDEKRSVDAGACGYETQVTRTLATQGDADPSNDYLPTADDLASGNLVSGQIGGISALFLAVIGLLRSGPSPEVVAASRLRTRIKRTILTWLPLAIVGLVAVYLQLLWMFHYLIELKGPFTPSFVAWTAVLIAGASVLAYLVDANATSMHGYYRARLADAFCVGVDPVSGRADELPKERVYRYSELDDLPLNVVTTLNSKAPNEAPTMRGGFPLVFGPHEVRVFREEGWSIAIPMEDYEDFAGAGRTSVMASVAISGAAISPLMGRFGVQMAPYRLLLTVFNLRVGTWVRNPIHTHRPAVPPPKGWLWLTSKPGLTRIAVEAAGKLSADDRWVYLSDGGHLDNTGLVECVRQYAASGGKAARRILILDASNDPAGSWSAVGDAIAVIRADLDIDLQRQSVKDEPSWLRCYKDRGLQVVVVKAVRVDPPVKDATGKDWNAALPPNVQSFQINSKDFPRSSTTRQKFGDLEFEAYRGLGYAATATSLRMCGWIPGGPLNAPFLPQAQVQAQLQQQG